eukprot:2561159-Rhodomonas_salina.3
MFQANIPAPLATMTDVPRKRGEKKAFAACIVLILLLAHAPPCEKTARHGARTNTLFSIL